MTVSARGVPTSMRAPALARVLARLALLCVLAAVVAVLVDVDGRGLLVLLFGLVGLVLAVVGVWWVLAHRGVVRWAGFLLAVAAPVLVLVFYTRWGLWPVAVGSLVLCGAALGCARSAVRQASGPDGMRAIARPAARHPVLIMNPKSGGGKVDRFGLVEKAERLGARVILMDVSVEIDVAALAHRAVATGADLLGVAGGDGTQAEVAAVAAEHDVPFLVVSAGTRNHFAMDLGLDRADPTRCLDALTDGEEVLVDLGMVAGRAFVNTVSFGAYAQIVQEPAYRDAKAGTALDELPDLLVGSDADGVDVRADAVRLEAQQAVLVSNNPYDSSGLRGMGRRSRLDRGALGVRGVRVVTAAGAVGVTLRGSQAAGLTVLEARQVIVDADSSTIPVAVDGEALRLPTPVVCSVRPGALRVRVPTSRPGIPVADAPLDWRRVIALALGRPRRWSGGEGRPDTDDRGDTETETDTEPEEPTDAERPGSAPRPAVAGRRALCRGGRYENAGAGHGAAPPVGCRRSLEDLHGGRRDARGAAGAVAARGGTRGCGRGARLGFGQPGGQAGGASSTPGPGGGVGRSRPRRADAALGIVSVRARRVRSGVRRRGRDGVARCRGAPGRAGRRGGLLPGAYRCALSRRCGGWSCTWSGQRRHGACGLSALA